MVNFPKDGSVSKFQEVIKEIYGVSDDRLFSLSDLLSNQERFTMRALKGIRKNDDGKLRMNLLIATSWLMAVANRFHIDLEIALWKRFPQVCSYCGKSPCNCRKVKPIKRIKIPHRLVLKPKTLAEFQKMFSKIYPPTNRTLPEAGVHLSEEMGELSEAVHHFIGQHKSNLFQNIMDEMADYFSCIFGVANSASIDISASLNKMYNNNCHVCHQSPCLCSFSFVAKFQS